MRKLIAGILLSTLAFIPTSFALKEQNRQELEKRSILENGGFEFGKRTWTSTGSAVFSIDKSTPLIGFSSATWDASATGEFLRSASVTVPPLLQGRNCELKFGSSFNGIAGAVKVNVDDGTNDLVSKDLPVNSTVQPVSLNFVCPTSGTLRMEIESTANASIVEIDNVYMGLASNLAQVSQAELFGMIRYNTAANCTWIRDSTTYGDMVDTDCNDTTILGEITTHSTAGTLGFTAPNLPPGRYVVEAAGFIGTVDNVSNDQICHYRLADNGTRFGAMTDVRDGASQASSRSLVSGSFEVTAARSNVNISLQTKEQSGSADCRVFNDNTPSEQTFEFRIRRYPLETQLALTSSQSGWYIDADLGGGNVQLPIVDEAYTSHNNGSLDLVLRPGSADAQIACASGTAPEGLTCNTAAVDENFGISFIPPYAGKFEVCMNVTQRHSQSSIAHIATAFKLSETNLSDFTILQDGGTKVHTELQTAAGSDAQAVPVHICSIFSFDSPTRRVVRVFAETDLFSGSSSGNSYAMDRLSTVGDRTASWTVKPITQNLPMPVILNRVTTNDSGGARIEFATVDSTCSADPCTITSQSSSGISSINRLALGSYSINFSPAFSAIPVCTITTSGGNIFPLTGIRTVSSFNFGTRTVTSVPAQIDAGFEITCMGKD